MLIAIVLGLTIPSFDDWLFLTPDTFRYLSAARSLAESFTFGDQRLALPPGFSILLSPFLISGDFPLFSARLLLIAGWASAVVLTNIYYRRIAGPIIAFITSAFVATSPAILVQADYLLSELVFFPLAIAAVLVFESWRIGKLCWRQVLAGACCASAAVLVRSIGIVLLPLGLSAIWFRRSRTKPDSRLASVSDQISEPPKEARDSTSRRIAASAFFLFITMTPQIVWSLRESQFAGGYGYREIVTQARSGEDPDAGLVELQFSRLVRYGPMRLASIKEGVIPSRLGWRLFQPPLATPATWIIGGAVFLLLCWRAVRYRLMIDWFAVLTLAVLAIWPWDEGVRFVLPLLPAIWGVVVLTAMDLIGQKEGGVWPRRVATFVFILVLTVQLAESISHISRRADRSEKATDRFDEMREVAHQWDLYGGTEVDGACVLENENRYKTTVVGAAYIRRSKIAHYVDVKDDPKIEWGPMRGMEIVTNPTLIYRCPPPFSYRQYDLLENDLILLKSEY